MTSLTFNNETATKALSILAKIGVWSLLFSILYILKSFSLLIFLTFVFTYIQAKAVERLKQKIANRIARVFLVSILFWLLLVSTFAYVAPQFIKQGNDFVKHMPQYVSDLDKHIVNIMIAWENNIVLQDIIAHVEQKLLGIPAVTDGATAIADMDDGLHEEHSPTDNVSSFSMKNSPTINLINAILGSSDESGSYLARSNIRKVANTVRLISTAAFAIIGTFMLSLLFSFLIILDLPRLTKTISDLRTTKLRFIYNEVSESIKNFCNTMGKALEAQFFIAICNTVFTFICLLILGIQSKGAFLSVIVFVCSFIPIVGVFVSSIPICLFALQRSGFNAALLAMGLIVLIHIIEAYILNPRIYGARLKLNPIIVLIVITICGKLFHMWGFVLGIPVFSYIFYHAIRHKKDISGAGHVAVTVASEALPEESPS